MIQTQDKTILMDMEHLQALRNTVLLDARADEAFDRLTNMSARILAAPLSFVSLIDVDRQYIQSGAGSDIREIPLSHSFCKHVVATGEPLIVNDARTNPLVKDNPAIEAYGVASYLGMPLLTGDGLAIGTLCVIDHKPRDWSEDELATLRDLSYSVMMEIELMVQLRLERENKTQANINAQGKEYFGAYQVVQKIGTGGMADVFLCKHPGLNVLVAIKHLRTNTSNHRELIQRFDQEFNIVSQLKHPNIIRTFESGIRDDRPYMVMEYINGEDLGSFLERNEQLEFYEDGAILLDIADALDYAHSKNIVHRDIKPQNILLRRRYRDSKPLNQFHATLSDFGIAKFTTRDSDMTEDNIVGTVSYMSPEQIETSDTLDYRADLYSFGVLTYRFLTGHLPFEADNIGAMINMHLTKPVPDPRQYVPHLSETQVQALVDMLAKNPEDRPRSAREFVIRLK